MQEPSNWRVAFWIQEVQLFEKGSMQLKQDGSQAKQLLYVKPSQISKWKKYPSLQTLLLNQLNDRQSVERGPLQIEHDESQAEQVVPFQ